MNVRRVVTRRTAEGKSVFVSDEPLPPVTVGLVPGGEFHIIWGADQTVQLPSDGSAPPMQGWFPLAGGFRFAFVTLGPATITMPADLDMAAAFAELNQKLPGLAEVIEPEHPGMHTTDTIDIDLVISGEVWLELDDGAERLLRAGDCVVQNGTRHAWRNKSSDPCVLAVALIGARGG
ncbi:MAG TPA: cupin domain-containing protein [Dehalococcoidia bacterium]|nr:cupin domain-containing protein [Dehalococcoidia bacterium]